jgi:hypothetical protein
MAFSPTQQQLADAASTGVPDTCCDALGGVIYTDSATQLEYCDVSGSHLNLVTPDGNKLIEFLSSNACQMAASQVQNQPTPGQGLFGGNLSSFLTGLGGLFSGGAQLVGAFKGGGTGAGVGGITPPGGTTLDTSDDEAAASRRKNQMIIGVVAILIVGAVVYVAFRKKK